MVPAKNVLLEGRDLGLDRAMGCRGCHWLIQEPTEKRNYWYCTKWVKRLAGAYKLPKGLWCYEVQQV